ncbi:protein of unknown function (DUF695) [Rubidibacter lacunae KORDI 51-2]|uniref:DUF695 domain-containing protein n=1 Tax=Rubidibacter lacunae KORDI 51-2 TaxID=582515 RepID=U5DLW1_9CHRO|nr:DUF695 domain-containing protein [Rubidibacter lacunae]ERN42646.1 protein of unknown function (DUF695) [Rubidibacter lacunae KORDI 51-2]
MSGKASEEKPFVIGRVYEDGLPLIYSFDDSMLSQATIDSFPWLTVISWNYDGTMNNGMPPTEINERMVELENELVRNFDRSSNSKWVFNRTGNNLKEFAYYIKDRDDFLKVLNSALSEHPTYPIEITFYHDPTWKEIHKLRDDFGTENSTEKGE